MPNFSRSPSEHDNFPRWDRQQKGFYEVWFLKANLVDTGMAFWLRYTLLIPKHPPAQAVAELWAIVFNFDQAGQHYFVKETFPISSFRTSDKFFFIQIGKSWLKQDSAYGTIQGDSHEISWSFDFEPNLLTYYHLPPVLRKAPLPKTKVCSPHIDIACSGQIQINTKTIGFQRAPAMQGHLWGTKHADRWVWAHCNTFEEEPDALIEALSAQIKIGGLWSPILSTVYIRYQGQHFYFNHLSDLLSIHSRFSLGTWDFEAGNRIIRFKGHFTAPEADRVTVRYTDPNGSHRFCHNSKIGKAILEIMRFNHDQWELETILTANHTCAIEWVESVL